MGVGFFWYSPAAFGKQWMALAGMTPEKIEAAKREGQMGKTHAINFLATIVTSAVIEFFIAVLGIESAGQGMQVALLAWLGFTAATTLGDYLYTKRPMKLFVINDGHYLATFLVMGAVLGAWR